MKIPFTRSKKQKKAKKRYNIVYDWLSGHYKRMDKPKRNKRLGRQHNKESYYGTKMDVLSFITSNKGA